MIMSVPVPCLLQRHQYSPVPIVKPGSDPEDPYSQGHHLCRGTGIPSDRACIELIVMFVTDIGITSNCYYK